MAHEAKEEAKQQCKEVQTPKDVAVSPKGSVSLKVCRQHQADHIHAIKESSKTGSDGRKRRHRGKAEREEQQNKQLQTSKAFQSAKKAVSLLKAAVSIRENTSMQQASSKGSEGRKRRQKENAAREGTEGR